MPRDGSVQFQNLIGAMGVLVVAGPKARQLLERVSDADFTTAAFPWLTGQEIVVGQAPTKALRVNFVGELGWELHHGLEYQNHIFDALMAAGADLGLAPFGIRAMDSLRIEKSYRLIGTELSIEYAAYESGLERFVHPNKCDFIGRDALVRWRERGFSNQFVTLEVDGVTDADALGNNPIYQNGQLVGRATGGNYGFRLEKSLALAMVRPEHRRTRHRAGDGHPGHQAPGDRDPREPLRPGEPAPAQLTLPVRAPRLNPTDLEVFAAPQLGRESDLRHPSPANDVRMCDLPLLLALN